MALLSEAQQESHRPWLSVIVPVYNEVGTVDKLLRRLRDGPYPEKEVIVVDDGSSDGTTSVLQDLAAQEGFIVLRHSQNRGKGAAVLTGLAQVRGQIVIIQDADLEYDPADFPALVERVCQEERIAVYGSRYLRPLVPLPWSRYRLAVTLLNFLVWLLYGRRLRDEATCYKVLRTDLLRRLCLTSRRFEFCAEVTAKLCRLGIPIVEVPISYHPRTVGQGKKITWRDVWPTIWALLKWRFLPLRFPPSVHSPHHDARSLLREESSGEAIHLTRQCTDIVI